MCFSIKVAIIEPVGGHGGMNYYDFGLAGGIANAGGDVIIYTSDETNVPNGLLFEVKKTFKGVWGGRARIIRATKYIYGLFLSLIDAKKNGVSTVHYHFFHYSVLESLCVRLANIFGFKVIVTAHDIGSLSGENDTKKIISILGGVSKVVAHNEVSKNALIYKALLPSTLIKVIPHGNYLNSKIVFKDKKVARSRIELAPDDKIILFFGQIKKVKGLDVLLRSLPEVIKQYPDIKLLVAGKVWKDDFSSYEKIINEIKIGQNVISRIRYIRDDEVGDYYRSADLVVLPYKKIYQSGVVLMAMSYKVPVLASDIAGMAEIIEYGVNGYMFQSENIGQLSLKLVQLLSDIDGLTKIGEAGFETVVRNHSWETIGKITYDLYKAVNCA